MLLHSFAVNLFCILAGKAKRNRGHSPSISVAFFSHSFISFKSKLHPFPLVDAVDIITDMLNTMTIDDDGMIELETETVPFVLPQYIQHEFMQDENMVKLKGRHVLKNIIDTDQPVDTILSLQDGKIGAHRIVLVAVSEFLEDLLSEQEEFRTITLILPDITKKTMETILNIAYTGKLIYSESEENEVLSAMETLSFCEDVQLIRQRVLNPIPRRYSTDVTPGTYSRGMPKALEARNECAKNTPIEAKSGPNGPSEPNQCKVCYRTFKSANVLAKHLISTHTLSQTLARPDEIKKITYCSTCDIQYSTLIEVKKCLEKHKVGRCWICLDEVSKVDMKLHYETKHVTNRKGETNAQCRWCPKYLNLSKGPGPLLLHCNAAHFASLGAPNISTRDLVRNSASHDLPYRQGKPSKRTREGNSPNTSDSNSKRIRFAAAESHSGPLRPHPPFFRGFSKDYGKIKIDMSLLPRLRVDLEKISPDEFAYYTAKRETQMLLQKGHPPSEELFVSKKIEGIDQTTSSEMNLYCESKPHTLIGVSEHIMKEFCNFYANLCLKSDECKPQSDSSLVSNNITLFEETPGRE